MGRHFKVKIDHDSLKKILEQRLSLEEKQKWVTKMLGYDLEIIYKKGKLNVVEDALSRKNEEVEAFLCAISIIQTNWITKDSLWYKDRLYIFKNSQLKQKILLEFHTSPLGEHSGFLKTYKRVKKYFFWDGLKSDIQNFMVECLVC